MILNKILELYPDGRFLKVNGFDDAVIGVDYTMKLVYSIYKMLSILMEDMNISEEAIEYFDYNIASAYMGERTPIYINNNDFNTTKELRREKLNNINNIYK